MSGINESCLETEFRTFRKVLKDLATSLKFERLHRIELDGLNMIKDEIIFEAGSRVRDVEIGPNGMIYVALEDPGRIVQISRYRK